MIAGHSSVDMEDLHLDCLLINQRDHAVGLAQDACRPIIWYGDNVVYGGNHRPPGA